MAGFARRGRVRDQMRMETGSSDVGVRFGLLGDCFRIPAICNLEHRKSEPAPSLALADFRSRHAVVTALKPRTQMYYTPRK